MTAVIVVPMADSVTGGRTLAGFAAAQRDALVRGPDGLGAMPGGSDDHAIAGLH
jgi:hypothetical protein